VSSQWIEKPVATRKPEAMEWVEYSVEWQLRLRSEGSLHVAVLLVTDGVTQFGRLPAGVESDEVSLRLKFRRHRGSSWPEWPVQREVWVNLGQSSGGAGSRVSTVIVSEALWLDPRPHVSVSDDDSVETGSVCTLATSTERAFVAQAAMFGDDDVRVTHGRWKADASKLDRLPSSLAALTEGRRAGELPAWPGDLGGPR